MRILQHVLVSLCMLAASTLPAAADEARCTITRIKDKDVSIDVAVTAKIGPDVFCKTRAQSTAKEYAKNNPVCAKDNPREGTFPLTVEFGTGRDRQTFELTTYCPPLQQRK